MKILLVYPECPVTYWAFQYALKFMKKKALSVAFHGTRADREKIGHFLELVDNELPCKDCHVCVQGIPNRGKRLMMTSGMEIPQLKPQG